MRHIPRHQPIGGQSLRACQGSGLPIPDELYSIARRYGVECPFCEQVLAIEGETMGRTIRKTAEHCCLCGRYVRTIDVPEGPEINYGGAHQHCAEEYLTASPERIAAADANIQAQISVRRAQRHLDRFRSIHGAHRRLATLAIAAVAMLSLLTACGRSPVAPSEPDPDPSVTPYWQMPIPSPLPGQPDWHAPVPSPRPSSWPVPPANPKSPESLKVG